MRLVFILCFLFSLILSAGNFQTPLLGDALALYFVHNGGSFRSGVRVSARDSAAIIRFYDADENLVYWKYLPLDGFETIEYHFPPESKPGIYQIRVSGINLQTTPFSMPEKQYAFMTMRGHLRTSDNSQFKQVFFSVPKGKSELLLEYNAVRPQLQNANGSPVRGGKKIKLNPPEQQVWSFFLSMTPGKSWFGTDGFPVIYAPDAKTAEAVGLSREIFQNKTYPHKFQCRLAEWVSRQKRSDFELEPTFPLAKVPKKASPFFFLAEAIRRQNIDPASPQFGKCLNPVVLALAFSINEPWNPWYKNPVLQRRILAASFYDLLQLRENDTFHTDGWNTYGASSAERVLSLARTFAAAAPLIPGSPLKQDWENGIRRIADRYLLDRESSASQSSYWPLIFYYLYLGTGEKGYRALAADFVKGMCLPENNYNMRIGYFRELGGADAGRQAQTVANLALYWRLSGDKNALIGLNRAFSLMNYTAAPDPDGTIHGASNFNHRTVFAWDGSRLEGGAALLSGAIYPAACWPLLKNRPKETVFTCTRPSSVWFSEYLFPPKPLKGALFPAEKNTNFMTDFNGIFYAVKRSSYYMLLYTGTTARGWELKEKRPTSAENKKMPQRWAVTQGISLLWFKDYGTLICAKNWNGNTGCFLRADLGRKCAYPDYTAAKTDTSDKQIFMTGKLNNGVRIPFTRTFAFTANGPAVRIVLGEHKTSPKLVLYEQLPLLKKKGLDIRFYRKGKWETAPGHASAVQLGPILLKLDRERQCSFGPESSFKGETILPLRLHFDTEDDNRMTYYFTQM